MGGKPEDMHLVSERTEGCIVPSQAVESRAIEESRSNGKAKENKINSSAATLINSEITTTKSSKLEGVQSIAPSPQRMIAEEHFRGIQKPPIKYVFQRRGKKQQVTESINKSPSNKMDKLEVAPHSSSNATRTGASSGCDMLDNKDCSEMEPKRELNMEGITPVEESKKSPKLEAWRESEYNDVAAHKINSKKSEISEDTSIATKDELITRLTKEGIQKPPIKHVFKRRGKKQQVTESINKSPSNKMDKEVAPHSSSNATRTGASHGCDMLDKKDSSEMEPKRELNMEEITPVEESRKSQKLEAWRETEYNDVAAPKINSKKSEISEDTSRTTKDELITRHTKGVGMDQIGSGVQFHKKEEHTIGFLEIQQLAEILNVSMEDATMIYTDQKEIAKAKVAYEYKEGKDLLATKREMDELSPAMRKLHDYYLADTLKPGCSSFGVCIPKYYIFEKEEETHWVEYVALFQLYQRRDLDLQIMMMWTLLEAKYCLKKGLDHIAFLDPVRVNGNTCKGVECNVKDLVDELTKIFYRIKHKSNILLAYNCTGHYVLIDIKLAEARVEVWDSKRRKLSYVNDLLNVLNNVKENMDGNMMIQFKAHYMEAHTLEQPMANNNCGFYVMWAMHEYLGRNKIEGNQMRNELETQQLLDIEIRGFQNELALFINDEVMATKGSFSIWQAKNRSSFDMH